MKEQRLARKPIEVQENRFHIVDDKFLVRTLDQKRHYKLWMKHVSIWSLAYATPPISISPYWSIFAAVRH